MVDEGLDQGSLLAPGAVQLFNVPAGTVTTTYLAVANSLSNNVLVYQEQSNGEFGSPMSYPVGDDPVSITVARLVPGGMPDLLVANKGSNDVSVLIGSIDTDTGLWTPTPYQRLSSGGSGPVSVGVRTEPNSTHGPDLIVTNSDGTAVLLPGIGSGGNGSGFFQDNNPQPVNLGQPIVQAVFDPTKGEEFVLRGDGGISVFDGKSFTNVFDISGDDVTALAESNDRLVAGFADGEVDLLTENGMVVASSRTGFQEAVSGLAVMQNGEIAATQLGSDLPIIVSFANQGLVGLDVGAIVTNGSGSIIAATLPSGVLATSINNDLILVAILRPAT